MRTAVASVVVLVCCALGLVGCTTATGSSSTDSPGSASGSSSSAEPSAFDGISVYYPVGVGNTWVYTIDYGNGTVVTDTEVMTKVTPEGDGARVTIERTFTWSDNSQPDLINSVDYVFNTDGSLSVPFQTLPSGSGTVTVNSGELVWPTTAEFEAGTPRTGQITASIDSGGTVSNEVVEFTIVGAGTEDVTVTAGPFTARKLLQKLVVSLPDLGVTGIEINSTTWLAENVGPVRTELPDMTGGATIVQQLVSFTPGS